MNEDTQEFLSDKLVSGILGLDILNISDVDYEMYHSKAEDVVQNVYKKDKELYNRVTSLLDALKINGLWRGRDFAFCEILKAIVIEVDIS